MRLALLISLGLLVFITASLSGDAPGPFPASGNGYLSDQASAGTETFTSTIQGGISIGAGVEVIQGGIQVDGQQQWTKTWDVYTASLSTIPSNKTAKSIYLDLFSGALIAAGVRRCDNRGETTEIDYEIIGSNKLTIPLSIIPAWAQSVLTTIARRTFTWSNVNEYLKSNNTGHNYTCVPFQDKKKNASN